MIFNSYSIEALMKMHEMGFGFSINDGEITGFSYEGEAADESIKSI